VDLCVDVSEVLSVIRNQSETVTKRILENDGKNLLQLKAAQIHRYLEKIVFIRLSSRHKYGTLSPWFNDVKLDTLIVWILWASTDRGASPKGPSSIQLFTIDSSDTLRNQPLSFRKLVSDILHPFIVMGQKVNWNSSRCYRPTDRTHPVPFNLWAGHIWSSSVARW
jgi:hypothetical protein